MASTKLFMVLVIAAIFVPSISAVDYVVGDDKGWTINFDYQSWALDKVFYVGDKLGTYIYKSLARLCLIYLQQYLAFLISLSIIIKKMD